MSLPPPPPTYPPPPPPALLPPPGKQRKMPARKPRSPSGNGGRCSSPANAVVGLLDPECSPSASSAQPPCLSRVALLRADGRRCSSTSCRGEDGVITSMDGVITSMDGEGNRSVAAVPTFASAPPLFHCSMRCALGGGGRERRAMWPRCTACSRVAASRRSIPRLRAGAGGCAASGERGDVSAWWREAEPRGERGCKRTGGDGRAASGGHSGGTPAAPSAAGPMGGKPCGGGWRRLRRSLTSFCLICSCLIADICRAERPRCTACSRVAASAGEAIDPFALPPSRRLPIPIIPIILPIGPCRLLLLLLLLLPAAFVGAAAGAGAMAAGRSGTGGTPTWVRRCATSIRAELPRWALCRRVAARFCRTSSRDFSSRARCARSSSTPPAASPPSPAPPPPRLPSGPARSSTPADASPPLAAWPLPAPPVESLPFVPPPPPWPPPRCPSLPRPPGRPHPSPSPPSHAPRWPPLALCAPRQALAGTSSRAGTTAASSPSVTSLLPQRLLRLLRSESLDGIRDRRSSPRDVRRRCAQVGGRVCNAAWAAAAETTVAASRVGVRAPG